MKYEVGDEVEIDLYYVNPRFKIEEVDTSRINPYKVNGSWWTAESLKPTTKEEGNSKYSPEQIAYLDQCAIAAMTGLVENRTLWPRPCYRRELKDYRNEKRRKSLLLQGRRRF